VFAVRFPPETKEILVTDTATATLSRRRVQLGDLHLEHRFWSNPRSFSGLSDQEIDDLGANIKSYGIEVPPHVVRVLQSGGSEINLVIDGQRRVTAALRVLPKSTPVEVFDLEDAAIALTPAKAAELLRRALNIGQNRKTISSFELSAACETLRDQGLKMSDIARTVDMSDTWVSKMLKARSTATLKLMMAWQKGEITDEMFKELASLDSGKQSGALETAKTARESGDKAGARVAVKETIEVVKREKAEKTERERETPRVVNGHTKKGPVVHGPQEELFERKADKKEDGPKPPSRVVLEDLRQMFSRKPPTDAYVKGLMDGVNYALGFTNPDKFANSWVVYLARVEGRAVKSARHASRKSTKKAKVAKARKPAKKAKSGGKKARR
jgi:ParB-like chromosome segregation protein Spo0J